MKKFLAIFLLPVILVSPALFSDQFIVDPYLSPNSSSNSYLYLENRLMQLQSSYFKSQSALPIRTQSPKEIVAQRIENLTKSKRSLFLDSIYGKILMGTLRAAEISFIWYPLHQIAATVQHEIFGHGYRIRTLPPSVVQVKSYKIQFAISPYGLRPTQAYTSFSCDPSLITPSEELAITSAGIEAESIFAHNILMSWLEKGRVNPRQVSLWQINSQSLFNYIYSLKYKSGKEIYEIGKLPGHDIGYYIFMLNMTYPSHRSLESQYNEISERAGLGIVMDPFTYISIYSHLWYILFHKHIEVPGIKLGPFKGLPSYNYALTPFGPENVYQLYYWGKETSPGYLYFKQGRYASNSYLGFGYESASLFKLKIGSFGLKADFWIQPSLIKQSFNPNTKIATSEYRYITSSFYMKPVNTGLPNGSSYRNRFGGSISLIYKYVSKKTIFQGFLNHIWLQVGYKTEGFMPGEPLSSSPIIKLGLGYLF